MHPHIALGLFVLSMALRLWRLDLMEFKADQILSYLEIQQFWLHPQLMARGLLSSLGIFNAPLFHYLLIPFGYFSSNPQALAAAVVLLGSLAPALLYVFFSKRLPGGVALTASLLLATSPWAIRFSRIIWAQSMLPFFVVLYLICFDKSTDRNKNMPIGLSAFLVIFMIQLHLSGMFLALSSVIFLVFFRNKFVYKPILIGALLGLIPAVPYIFFQLRSVPLCPDCLSLYRYITLSKAFDITHLWRVLQINSGLHFQYLMGESYMPFQNNLWVALAIFSFSFSPFFILYGAYRSWPHGGTLRYMAWLAGSLPFLYILFRTPAYIHYYIIILPVLSVLEALGHVSLITSLRHRVRFLALASLAIILVLRVAFWGSFLSFLDEHSTLPGDYGPAYKVVIQPHE